MRVLNLKVLRDVLHLKGQMIAVAVLVACGVAVFIMLRSMNGYLRGSQDQYYADYGFGEIFAHATRVPGPVEERLRSIPGVDAVQTRIVRDVLLDLPGLPEPATGRMVSLPDHGEPRLNRLFLESGALPGAGRRDEVVVSSAFAAANGFRVGDGLAAVLNGRRENLTVVGVALSPEFIYEVSGIGSMFPDNRRFGAMWMSLSAMGAAFDMEGGFNDVVATLAEGADERPVLDAMDEILEPFGGTGAYGRDLHLSHQFVTSEIEETKVTASFFPALFLVVTAFLLHTTMLRLVRMEREAIGLMKAFGLRGSTVAVHYLEMALLPVTAGAVAGAGAGIWLADRMAGVYARFFQFPELEFQLDPTVVAWALAIALITGITGALAATRSVVRLAPAVAMAPPSPPRFHGGRMERTRLWGRLTPTERMVVRNVTRARWKSASTAVGVALSLGVLGALLSMFDAIDFIAELQFRHAYREDLAVYFDVPRGGDAVLELERLPGVLTAEPVRMAPARLTHGHREERVSLMGLVPEARLRRIVDDRFRSHPPPPDGVLLGSMLAASLGAEPGDVIRVEVTEGDRPEAELPVTGVVEEFMGTQAYMEIDVLRRLLGEGRTVSGVWLEVDPARQDEVLTTLKELPGVSSVMVKEALLEGFEATIQESFLIALTSTLVLGALLVMAIVYNQARVALSERGRELASLRVLGFSRPEVARMLLGEQGVLVATALPFGLGLAWFLTWLVMRRFETDVFRLPVIAEPETYLQAVAVVLVSAAISAFLVRRRLDRIDLISVLKTRE